MRPETRATSFLLLLALGCAPVPRPEVEFPSDDDDSAADDDSADDDDSAGDDDDSAPPQWPEYPHLDDVVDLARGETPVWASITSVRDEAAGTGFRSYGYADTADRTDFWVASTIKTYTATAALVLLADFGLSLDTTATFFRRAGPDDAWVEDASATFRQMIFDVFDHSSNSAYTLLLRFAGADWLNAEFLIEDHGLGGSALLVGYVSERPWQYRLGEEQRIVLVDGETRVERTHAWSGTPYDDDVGCAFRYGARANCSPPAELAEHMRRLFFHEVLPESEQFDVEPSMLDWMRYGDGDVQVMNQGDSPYAQGILRVFPDAAYHHKAGRVGRFALDMHYVDDLESDTRFAAAVATESEGTAAYRKVSEELTRMLATPATYVHLDTLVDHVNPVEADLWVHSEVPGTLELASKPFSEDGMDPDGWDSMPGTAVEVARGDGWHALGSVCLDAERHGRHHVRGRFTAEDGTVSTSDLHYVIVDANLPCP